MNITSCRHILLCLRYGIGDVVMELPALDALRQAAPQARITALGALPALELLDGDQRVDRLQSVQNLGLHHWGDFGTAAIQARIRRWLAEEKFDLVLDPSHAAMGAGEAIWDFAPPILDAGAQAQDTALAAGGNGLTAVKAAIHSGWGITIPDDAMPRLPLRAAEASFAAEFLRRHRLTGKPVGLSPVASSSLKRWPVSRFAELADSPDRRRLRPAAVQRTAAAPGQGVATLAAAAGAAAADRTAAAVQGGGPARRLPHLHRQRHRIDASSGGDGHPTGGAFRPDQPADLPAASGPGHCPGRSGWLPMAQDPCIRPTPVRPGRCLPDREEKLHRRGGSADGLHGPGPAAAGKFPGSCRRRRGFMASLIVCRSPGDELTDFGGLILGRPQESFEIVAVFAHPLRPDHLDGEKVLRQAAADLGVERIRLLPFAHLAADATDPDLIASLLPDMRPFTRVYTHAVQDPRPLARRVAAAVGSRRQEVWTTAAGGEVQEVVRCRPATFARRLECIHRHYPDLLSAGLIAAEGLRSVDLFQQFRGESLYRYFRVYLDWRVDSFPGSQPWDFETSPYEQERHAAEIRILTDLPWRRMVEVGACEGTFTEMLCRRFPERRIVACEPDRHFYGSLQKRIGARAELRQADCEAAGEIPCDLLFVSSLIYYCPRFPYRMLATPAEHVVISHAPRYHRDIVDPALQAAGFRCLRRDHTAPRIETMEGIQEVRYGTEIAVWQRRREG